ncbi:uncharacterized protein LOC118456530 [Anopheles albimanus]|uniref:Uncharacterized protein n=1 Tax=Anopheles albimanus TaxID=7167 RepID=A0A182FKA6_ANOAL|nr:uncharacterized protein LOC118456530 [Anopheles albimanus]
MLQLRHSSQVVMLLVLSLLHVLAASLGTDTLAPGFQSRRVSKSSASIDPQHQPLLSPVATASRVFKRRNGGTSTTLPSAISTLAKEPRKVMVQMALGLRLEQNVQQVQSRRKELRMEQEQKRVDRKLRRDKLKQERTVATTKPVKLTMKVAEPVNQYKLQMPDCGADGKVYNGRRCVLLSKMKTKH